jgi:protease-4
MEPISSQAPPVVRPQHNVRQFLFAVALVLPAILFWTLLALLGSGIYGLIAVLAEKEQCTVASIPLHGELLATAGGYDGMVDQNQMSTADTIVDEIHAADADSSVHAIILDVDSPGGSPVAGDEVARALQEASKPTVVVMHDQGASAAYWASAGADHIVASPISDVGSIGVTMSYTEQAGANKENGSRWIGIASGDYKDAGNPDRPLTNTEKEYFQTQVDAVYQYMLDRISTMRPVRTREQYAELADGRSYLGSEAVNLGLVDQVGGVAEALAYVEHTIGLRTGGAVLCTAKSMGWSNIF